MIKLSELFIIRAVISTFTTTSVVCFGMLMVDLHIYLLVVAEFYLDKYFTGKPGAGVSQNISTQQ